MIVYDLHTHTTASDGLLTPTELVQRAVKQGVDVLAITDHDTTAGFLEAAGAIASHQLPLQCMTGVEITSCWGIQDIHVVGLQISIDHDQLQSLLTQQCQQRYHRARAIADYLAQQGVPGIWSMLVTEYSDTAALTRYHIAQVLVRRQICRDTQTAFRRYLTAPALKAVAAPWCTLAQAVQVIQAAGGQAVLAHPGRYGLGDQRLQQLIADFCSAGGDALEVAHCRQSSAQRQLLARYAQRYQLLASQGSDFHYPGGHYELGCDLRLPLICTPIGQSWVNRRAPGGRVLS
jgi:3',5'-nucleoside bisphosphate phosphatase